MSLLDYSTIHNLLFNENTGVCIKLNSVSVSDVKSFKEQFDELNRICSESSNINDNSEKVLLYEQIFQWGCESVARFLLSNAFINETEQLLDLMQSIYNFIPSYYSNHSESLFQRDSIILLFKQLQLNGHVAPNAFIQIFTKILKFCPKDIINESLFLTIMTVICDLVQNSQFDSVVADLFLYGSVILQMHVDHHDSPRAITTSMNLIHIVVRTEKHAVARLYYWWHLICVVNKDTLQTMIEPCYIAFWCNLFGKYPTLDKQKNFNYKLSPFNCDSNRTELESLCHCAMGQFVQTIAEHVPPGLSWIKNDHALKTLSINIFRGSNTIELHIDSFLAIFYHWCNFCSKTDKSLALRTLKSVFHSFGKRLLWRLMHETNTTAIKADPDSIDPTLYSVIERFLNLKNLLEREMKGKDRDNSTIFFEHTGFMAYIYRFLRDCETNTESIQGWREVANLTLCASLHTMKQVLLRSSEDNSKIVLLSFDTWIYHNRFLIEQILPSTSNIDQEFMTQELDQINHSWFTLFDKDKITLSPSPRRVWHKNMELWCFLSLRIATKINDTSFTLSYATSYNELRPMVEYLLSPILLLQQLDLYSLGIDDFEYFCDVHNSLYCTFASKANLICDTIGRQWREELCVSLVKHLSNVDSQSYDNQSLLLNFIARFIRLIVSDLDTRTEGLVWQSVSSVLETVSSWLDLTNVRVIMKGANYKKKVFITDASLNTIPMAPPSEYDPYFTLGLILSATKSLVIQIGQSQSLLVAVMDKLSLSIAKMADVIFKRKEKHEINEPLKYSSALLDQDTSEAEKHLVSLLRHIQKISTDEYLFSILNPIFVTLFSFNVGTISKRTILVFIECWNKAIIGNKNKSRDQYTKTFIRDLRTLKVKYPHLEVPHKLLKVTVNLADNSAENIVFGSLMAHANGSTEETRSTPKKGGRPRKNSFIPIIKSTKKRKLSIKNMPEQSNDVVAEKGDDKRQKRPKRNQSLPIRMRSEESLTKDSLSINEESVEEPKTKILKTIERSLNNNSNQSLDDKNIVDRPKKRGRQRWNQSLTIPDDSVEEPSKRHLESPPKIKKNVPRKRTTLSNTIDELLKINGTNSNVTMSMNKSNKTNDNDMLQIESTKTEEPIIVEDGYNRGSNDDTTERPANIEAPLSVSSGDEKSSLVIGPAYSMAEMTIHNHQRKTNVSIGQNKECTQPSEINRNVFLDCKNISGATTKPKEEIIIIIDDDTEHEVPPLLRSPRQIIDRRPYSDSINLSLTPGNYNRPLRLEASKTNLSFFNTCPKTELSTINDGMLPNTTKELNRFKEALKVVKEGLREGSYERYRETMKYLFNND